MQKISVEKDHFRYHNSYTKTSPSNLCSNTKSLIAPVLSWTQPSIPGVNAAKKVEIQSIHTVHKRWNIGVDELHSKHGHVH